MSIWDDLASADPSFSSVYPLPGLFEAEIVEMKISENRNEIPVYVVRLETTKSGNAERPVGGIVDWVVVRKDKKMADGNVKEFFLQAMKCAAVTMGDYPDSAPPTGEEMRLCFAPNIEAGETNPLLGMKIAYEATNKPQKGDKTKNFTKMTWGYTEAQKAALAKMPVPLTGQVA